MKIEHRMEGDVSIIRILEDIDAGNAMDFREFLTARLAAGDLHLVLDFSVVKFMDSSGIGAIVQQYQILKPKGGRMVFAGCSDALQRVFKIVGLAKLFPIFPTVEQTLSALKK